MTLVAISIAAFCATLFGGMVALRLRDRLHLILGFSAGAVISVAFFDLIPEALEMAGSAYTTETVFSVIALGFLLYLLLDRLLLLHNHDPLATASSMRGVTRAGALSVHSFLDGVAIGFAFQVSTAVGVVVAIAVLAHDFSDGINTVSVIVRHGGSRAQALKWLLVDALAPVLGIVSTLLFSVTEVTLGLILALFAGFFLYISASDLIPESHHAHPTFWTTAATLVGAGVLYSVIQLAGI